ncbi:hypothetical protein FHT44_004907 [Mycolicibacterium sp. BK634]|uniref:hypothetical protein n=1 Tax=Mycolicibacterium sp. BK634 TaxID=2587099 RepID=UPI00160B08C2|nr:hypothetical protein [Mycolicibacterium sp. BK634]MBB3752395.1 hypothetical protein [Mycolicibacterium sp. BK634]
MSVNLRDLLQRAVDQREAKGLRATGRSLAAEVGKEEAVRPRGMAINYTTASSILKGKYGSRPTPETIRAVAWLAGVKEEEAFAAAKHPIPGEPFTLPDGADELEPGERKAIFAVVQQFVAQRREINRLTSLDTSEVADGDALDTAVDRVSLALSPEIKNRNQGRKKPG